VCVMCHALIAAVQVTLRFVPIDRCAALDLLLVQSLTASQVAILGQTRLGGAWQLGQSVAARGSGVTARRGPAWGAVTAIFSLQRCKQQGSITWSDCGCLQRLVKQSSSWHNPCQRRVANSVGKPVCSSKLRNHFF